MPTDALPIHLARRGENSVLEDADWIRPIFDFTTGISQWATDLFGVGMVGTAAGASQVFNPNSPIKISPQSEEEGQHLPGTTAERTTGAKVPETQPAEDSSFYGSPKPAGSPPAEAPERQPDLGTVWLPKSGSRGQ